jgi:hypothetical protein
MRRKVYKKSAGDIVRSALIPLAFTLAVMGMIVYGLRQTEAASRAEGLRILEDSIRRAVVMSYAIEGRYPESLEYVEEHFGIHINRDVFHVHYEIFASNIMPDIMVMER